MRVAYALDTPLGKSQKRISADNPGHSGTLESNRLTRNSDYKMVVDDEDTADLTIRNQYTIINDKLNSGYHSFRTKHLASDEMMTN